MTEETLPYKHLLEFHKITQELSTYKDVDVILDKILYEARKMSCADAGSIFLAENNTLRFNYFQNDTLASTIRDVANRYSDFTIPINTQSIAGYTAVTGAGLVIDDAYEIPSDMPYHFNPSFDRQTGYRTRSIITVPLQTLEAGLVGIMQLINAKDFCGNSIPFDREAQVCLPLFANHAALAIERGLMNRELILRIMYMAEMRDPAETGAHVQRVGAYCAEIYEHIARKKKESPQQIRRTRDVIRLAAMVHDVGKVAIEDRILKKPAKLTDEEFDAMKWHTIRGGQLFSNTRSSLDAISRDICLYHHEKWNGTGYPGKILNLDTNGPGTGPGLSGEEIPLPARITALADVYDALSSRRSYKDPWPLERIHGIIRSESGQHFDPDVVAAFFEIQDVILAIQKRFQS